ncbi:MAG: HAMP domain-containing sensor histidine kinase [Acidimicrobiia bacterium]|nr:MAG: HAMP domain-containing sensor histidine kinase [Acidimicrobiia bacterium]
MRRRLILLSGAITAMVVLAFLVPLFILVGDLAGDRAISGAERDAESLARVLSVLTVDETIEDAVDIVGESRIASVNGSVIFPDGTVVGLEVPEDEDLSLALSGSSFIAPVDGGQAVYIPVVESDGSVTVVRVFVSDAHMSEGVARTRVVLGLLGVVLVFIAMWVSDRLGQTMVVPVKELSTTAYELGHGNLEARVEPSGPPEIEEVGVELNRLADRITRLLQDERESAADLAHRLRTPLTAARLSVDGLESGRQKDRLNADLDDLQRTTDFIIREARRPVRRESGEWCDMADVVEARVMFWSALAEEQGRDVEVRVGDLPGVVSIPVGDAEAMIDALLENVLAHTRDGIRFRVLVEVDERYVTVSIEDAGTGFDDSSVVERGTSSADSTGLGLDIVRRTVEGAGGNLALGESEALGGAGIVAQIPLATR